MIDDPFEEGGALEAAWLAFEAEQLPLPPIPSALLYSLEQRRPLFFSSHAGISSLADLDDRAEAAARGVRWPAYVAFGVEGYGVENLRLRYAVVTEPCAVFVDLPLGGLHRDTALARTAIRAALSAIARGLPSPRQEPLTLQHSERGGRWSQGAGWQTDADALAQLAPET